MNLTRSQADRQLEELYKRIPLIPDCDKRCWISCGPIDLADRERQRIRAAGYKITPWQQAVSRPGYYCDALTEEKTCAVYRVRPVVCRLFGAVDGLRCPYGCVPEGGWLSNEEGVRLVAESMRIGGHPQVLGLPSDPDLQAMLSVPGIRDAVRAIITRGQAPGSDAGVPAAFRKPARF